MVVVISFRSSHKGKKAQWTLHQLELFLSRMINKVSKLNLTRKLRTKKKKKTKF